MFIKVYRFIFYFCRKPIINLTKYFVCNQSYEKFFSESGVAAADTIGASFVFSPSHSSSNPKHGRGGQAGTGEFNLCLE